MLKYPKYEKLISLSECPFNNEKIESIINNLISDDDKIKLERTTFLLLTDLVKPRIKKNKVPRSQNAFVIFRKDLQAKLTFERGPSFTSNIKTVSTLVSKLWKEASPEQQELYKRIAFIAKKVRNYIWPNYSYKPRREKETTIPSPSTSPLLPPPPPLLPPSLPLSPLYPTRTPPFPSPLILPPITSFCKNNLTLDINFVEDNKYDRHQCEILTKFSLR